MGKVSTRKFSVIKIICCVSVLNLGVFEIYLMVRFGFSHWLNWMLLLRITDPFWAWALVNFLVVLVGAMIWSGMEPVHIIRTPVVVFVIYGFFVLVMKFANFTGQFPLFGIAHIIFLFITIAAMPLAVFVLNDELKYEWGSSIIRVLGAPIRFMNRITGLDKKKRPEVRTREEIPQWTVPPPERTEPAQQEAKAGSKKPEKKWYDQMIELQQQRYRRK